MFSPQSGNAYTHHKDENIKQYVDTVSETDTKMFIDSLKKIKELEIQYNSILENINEINSQLQKKHSEVSDAVAEHIQALTLLHDKLCKILAISGYNEFKHKIHIEQDNKVYIISKNVEVKLEDL